MDDAAALAAHAQALALQLPDDTIARLLQFRDELAKWNRTYNLTAIRDPNAMLTAHLADSLALLPHVRGPLLDVGSGAGLPGLLLAIVQPELAVTSVEAVDKKARFQRHIKRLLALDNATVAAERVEHFQSSAGFATVTCRAFASLADFTRQTRHLLAADGRWLAMKGRPPDDEIKGLDTDVTVSEIIPLQVPGLDAERCVVVMELAT
ncbi:16S rRNA (guanine(527)-N(7))-methyltransferase RsmG [bacterium]|nr:16S rRNA (guanine(527)-N(7))-methyltransferase RsmG [bacterium]